MKKYTLGFLLILFAFVSQVKPASAMETFTYQYNRDLQHGSSGNDVVLLEFCLARIYNNFYDIDGYFDSRTKRIIKDFQAKNNLRVDGILGSQTAAFVSAQCKKGSTQIYGGYSVKTNNKNVLIKKINTENTQVKTGLSFNDAHSEGKAVFTFKLRNTTSKDITLDGIENFYLSVNSVSYNGKDLDAKKGYKVDFYDKNKNLIKNSVVIKKDEYQRFFLVVTVDANKIDALEKTYSIRAEKLVWELGSKSKTLILGRTAPQFSVKKSS